MPKPPSKETKIKRGQGQGEGADYKPWHTVREVKSLGTAATIPDWKHGRAIHCLSLGEIRWYYVLRWDDNNVDIREQFPLWDENFSNKDTVRIAKLLGFRHPKDNDWIMTTDFLVTEASGGYHAYSVKPNRKLDDRTLEKLSIEMLYWKSHGVPFTMLFGDEVNRTLSANIRLVTEFYDPCLVKTSDEAIKHMVATKQFSADLEHEIINPAMLKRILLENTEGGGEKCLTTQSLSERS